jgi:prophage regulatory protein
MSANRRYLITWAQLKSQIPYGRQHIGRLEKQDRFPKRVQAGPGRVCWFQDEIDSWLASRPRGAPAQRPQLALKAPPSPEPDPEDLEALHRLLVKFGLEAVPTKHPRGRSLT